MTIPTLYSLVPLGLLFSLAPVAHANFAAVCEKNICSLPDGSAWTLSYEYTAGLEVLLSHVNKDGDLVETIHGNDVPFTNIENPTCDMIAVIISYLYIKCSGSYADPSIPLFWSTHFHGLIDLKQDRHLLLKETDSIGSFAGQLNEPLELDLVESIAYIASQNIVQGYPDKTYRPENPISRAEFSKIIIAAAFTGSTLSATDCFPDVKSDDWYSQYVCFAQERGVVSGHDDGFFKPADHVNAAEAAKIVTEAFQLDVDDGVRGRWYRKYWQALDEIDALPSTVTEPGQLLTRGEMAELVYRVMQSQDAES